LLKRLFWLMIGLGFGVGMSVFVSRLVREKVARFSPDNVASELAQALRDLGSDVRAAVSEGREAMREREAQLRAEVESGASQ
jgi:gas vesicle protein